MGNKTEVHLEQTAVDDLCGDCGLGTDAGDAKRHVGILVAEGRDHGEINRRSQVPTGGANVAGNRHTNRHLENVHVVEVRGVSGFEVVRGQVRIAQADVRNNLEVTGFDQVFAANTQREGVGVGGEVVDAEALDGNVVGAVQVAEVGSNVEVAAGL